MCLCTFWRELDGQHFSYNIIKCDDPVSQYVYVYSIPSIAQLLAVIYNMILYHDNQIKIQQLYCFARIQAMRFLVGKLLA